MVDKPRSTRFINMVSSNTISGTIPRDNETRPHIQVSYDDQDLRGQGYNDTKSIGMIGKALSGKPNTVYKITSLNQAKSIFKGGELLDAIELAWQPDVAAFGLNGAIYAERAENAKPADLRAGALTFKSRIYGDKANNIQVKLTQSSLDNTWTVQVLGDNYHQTYSNLGLLANIQYVPNSWSKQNMPAGAKDYARAFMEIKPRVTTHVVNGHKVTEEDGEAGEMVLKIHDTKQPAILHDNATNNIVSGSTVYESNGTEYESKNPASAGDPNPNAGPFVDIVKTFDLDSPKYRNVYDLFRELQSFPNINVQAVDDHNVYHIPTKFLDLTEQQVSIMPSLDDTTQDANGNIINPAGIWSTLGDIVDKMRNDNDVIVSADLSKQLNVVSTKATGSDAAQTKSYANSLSSQATSAKSAYQNNILEAQNASKAGNTDIASEFRSAALSESNVASTDSSNAAKLNSQATSLNASNINNITADDASASNTVKSASAAINKDNSILADLQSRKNRLPKGKHAAQASINANTSLASSINSLAANATSYSSYAASTSSEYAKDISYYNSVAKANKSLASSTKNASSAKSYTSRENEYLGFAKSQAEPQESFAAQANSYRNQKDSLVHSADASYNNSVAALSTSLTNEMSRIKNNRHQASSVASKATHDALKKDHSQGMPNNMQKAKNYVGNLIAQINSALDKGDLNTVDSDLTELSRVAETMGSPKSNPSPTMLKAATNMKNHLKRANKDRQNLTATPTAGKDLPMQLGPIKIAIDRVPSKEAAPKDLFVNNMGDGEISVLNEPIHAFNYTHLSGGYTYPVPYSWEGKFHEFDSKPVYDFVVLTDSPAIHQELGAYIKDRYYSDHNIRGFVGAGYKETTQNLISRASDLDDERLYLVGSSLIYPMQDGRKLHCPGYMTAAILAGIDASIPVGASILNKEVGASKLDANYSSPDLDALDQNGVIMVEPIVNRGATSEYVVGDDISTDNDSADPVKAELQLGEVTDFLFDHLRIYLRKYLGTEITGASHSVLDNAVSDFLDQERANANAGDAGLIISYNPDDIACEVIGETAYIAFSCAPVRTLKHIYVKGAYNGYDEQYGNGTREGNFFVGHNGQLVNDSGSQSGAGSFVSSDNPDGLEEDNDTAGNDAGGANGVTEQNQESPD